MIRGIHAMLYSPKADELRAFLRDALELPFTDVGGGWLIFDAPEVEVGCHPSDKRFHEISFYCDDIAGTVAALKAKGVRFASEVENQGWGLSTRVKLPGGGEVTLYQPRYEKTPSKKAPAKKKAAAKKPGSKKKSARK